MATRIVECKWVLVRYPDDHHMYPGMYLTLDRDAYGYYYGTDDVFEAYDHQIVASAEKLLNSFSEENLKVVVAKAAITMEV